MSISDKIRYRISPRKIYPPKACVTCGDNFTRPIDMQSTTWKSKITCSISCRNAKRSADAIRRNEQKHGVGCLDDKPCQMCGVNMTKDDSCVNYVFIRRLCCSKECANLLRKAARPKNYSSAKAVKTIAWHWEQRPALTKLIHDAILRPLLEK
jgi:hypothetical protein